MTKIKTNATFLRECNFQDHNIRIHYFHLLHLEGDMRKSVQCVHKHLGNTDKSAGYCVQIHN
jgi:hypothetical protein